VLTLVEIRQDNQIGIPDADHPEHTIQKTFRAAEPRRAYHAKKIQLVRGSMRRIRPRIVI
jgi:hypothetical protein